jgi:BRCA1 C Terminus (BRCT) domain
VFLRSGDGDDVYRFKTLDPSIPHIPGENGVSVNEDDNMSDEIMIQKTDVVLKGEIVNNEGVLVVEEKRNGRALMMSMQEELKGDAREEVEVIVQNMNVLETLHPEATSSVEMPQYNNTSLKLPITETTDAVVTSEVSQGYRFQFGGGDDEEMTYARTVVESLGGSVVTDDSCTHLVLWKITRTEKYLCACASGKVQCTRTFCCDTFHFSCLFSTNDVSNKELIHFNSRPSIVSQWILRPLYLAVCFEAAKDIAHHNSRRFLDEVKYEWGAEESLELLDEKQKLWAMAGRRWRLHREILQPFGGENVLIIGVTAPPAGTLSRMVVCGGGKASIVEDMSFLNKDDIIFSDRTLIIAASKSSTNGDDSLSKLCLLLGKRGVTALLKTPVYLLDVLCGASVQPAYTSRPAMINIIPSVNRPLQHKTPTLTLENVTIAPTQSKRRKVS